MGRNWSGRDLRNKRRIAIYTRNNLSVIDVYRSNLYEIICLTVSLPSENCILLSGLYHPPKTTYQECDLMDYLENFFDIMLDKHPNISIVCCGDLRPCLHGVGDPGLVGQVSFVLCPPERENKRNQPH